MNRSTHETHREEASMTDWDPALYKRFEGERTRPAIDLLARVALDAPGRVADLGCGPGNSTEIVAARYPGANVLGIDNSPAMIESASTRLPRAQFELADVATWKPAERFDLLFANATLQWVPDHALLFERLRAQLTTDGVLAVQVPDNLGEPSHALMREAARDAGRGDIVGGAEAERAVIGSFDDHWRWLAPRFRTVEMWRTTYVHPLEGHDGVVAWLSSTGLRPYRSRLAGADLAAFDARYRERIAGAYPLVEGKVLLPFPRLFVVASGAK